MFPYLSSADAPAIEQALCSGEFETAFALVDRRLQTGEDDPELRHLLGLFKIFRGDLAGADRDLERAYHELRHRGQPRKAALAAVSLGRLHHDGYGNQPVGSGWLARAVSLVEAEEPCLEQGWALLGLVGCNVADTERLRQDAERALELARRFDDRELECKALADGGLALVSLGRTQAGWSWLDQALVMLRSRECPNAIVVAQVVCDLLSACGRASDLDRAETWLAALEEMGVLRTAERRPAYLFTHCRIAYGEVLCDIGRWTDAEVALRLSVSMADQESRSNRVGGRAALAELLVRQGRLDAAASLLDGHDDRVEAAAPLAGLHLARGHHDLAAAVARKGLRMLGGDRLRAARLLLILVDAELGAGQTDAAQAASERLNGFAAAGDAPLLAALAARARGHLAQARGDRPAAHQAFADGLAALGDGTLPLERALLHLDLAELEREAQPAVAVAEARAALAIYQRGDAPGAARAAALLRALGEPVQLRPAPAHPLDVLSRRERQVFDLLAAGLSNAAIATRLFITAKTAEHHVTAILGKLGLRSRAEVAAYAAGLGLMPIPA